MSQLSPESYNDFINFFGKCPLVLLVCCLPLCSGSINLIMSDYSMFLVFFTSSYVISIHVLFNL